MRAAYIEQTGPPEVIQVGEVPKPQIGPGQVLVRVHTASVNPIDTYIRSGDVAAELPRPFIIGADFAGVVEEVGAGVTDLPVGLRVWGSNQGLLGRQGTFAEYVAADANLVYPTPGNVADDTAAAVPLVGITAHLGLVREANLQPGETLFINGGSGGVGSMVVQMAKAIGARVITTAGSEEKAMMCRSYGADLVLNYKTDDIPAAVKKFCSWGVDVWWETLRQPDFDRTIDLLAPRGRMIVMAGRDARPEFPVGPFYVKECRLLGFVMFKAPPAEQQKAAMDINGWLASGKLRVPIGATLPLQEAAAAHTLQEDNTLRGAGTLQGKIVVVVSAGDQQETYQSLLS
ncbi:NADPH:quinone reductase [Aeoliella sp. ICT_H6.2]|uniref:NADPH:quinone reductase n=1 Tax=Aeoliella straminimaris TaxID=2954799 RepID=A0A9X2FC18_9BACT|nr:NADPH:quinone reductase [Aeoliella straminimaris]MCO6045804.1 NADPH:quinone reductase [Aeoliella straminimaris]